MTRLAAQRQREAGSFLDSSGNPRVMLLSLAVGVISFFATEIMRYLLVPDIGRRWERWLAEAVSALIVAFLTGRLLSSAHRQREATLLRMQVISEMNHHVRNALAAIILSAESSQNQQSLQVIAESVNRIEWALREVLLRQKPFHGEDRNRPHAWSQGNLPGTPRRSAVTEHAGWEKTR